MPTRTERLTGGLLGMLVGDALGVPYEFHRPEHLPSREWLEMDPPEGFPRAHRTVAPGTWSDDGAQALCLLESLLECGRLHPEDLGGRFLAWLDRGHLAVGGQVFDVGAQTWAALRRLKDGIAAEEAGTSGERDNGNGSLMRVLPLALWHRGSDADLAADACRQSRVTHGHARSQACCAVYCLWARRILDESDDPWGSAVAAARGLWAEGSTYREELELRIRPEEPAVGRGGGYVLDCLQSARLVMGREASYEGAVKAAVALGDDTDTTACVVGGLAGLREGAGAIPPRWLDRLRGREMVDPLLERLLLG